MEDELKRAKLEREMAEPKAAELNARVQFMEMQKQVVEQPKEKDVAGKTKKPRAKAGERLWRRKARNLVAAARFRVMERKEREEVAGAMELLHARNRELRADIFAVQTGINFLKGLLPTKQPKAEPEEDLELDRMPALNPMKSMDDGRDQQQQQRQDDMPTTSKTAATAHFGDGLALGGWRKANKDQLTVKVDITFKNFHIITTENA
jgi:hypothetical protein